MYFHNYIYIWLWNFIFDSFLITWWNCAYIHIHDFFIFLFYPSQFSRCFFLISDFLALSHNERHQVETVVVLFALKARSECLIELTTSHIDLQKPPLFRWCFPSRSTSIGVIMRRAVVIPKAWQLCPEDSCSCIQTLINILASPSSMAWMSAFFGEDTTMNHKYGFQKAQPAFFHRFGCNWHRTWIWQVKHCWPGLQRFTLKTLQWVCLFWTCLGSRSIWFVFHLFVKRWNIFIVLGTQRQEVEDSCFVTGGDWSVWRTRRTGLWGTELKGLFFVPWNDSIGSKEA